MSDFGLAKLVSHDDHHASCTQMHGTFGYMAPEIASSPAVTEETDVFAFGVVLFELISGQLPVCSARPEPSLSAGGQTLAMEDRLAELADPRLGVDFDPDELQAVARCASLCCDSQPRGRPKFRQVVKWLEAICAHHEHEAYSLPLIACSGQLFGMPAESPSRSPQESPDISF